MPESNPPDDGRVTLAEIRRDIVHLIELFHEERETTDKWRQAADARLRYLETECQTAKTDMARMDERQKATTGALGVLIAIGSAIAAAVGTFVK